MNQRNQIEGLLGENIASEYLQKKGYTIVERNFRKRYGEIDIVVIENSGRDKTLVFVEVKTRKTSEFGCPEEAITRKKLKALVRTVEYYKLLHPNLPECLRIDAISISLFGDNSIKNLEHIKNISGF